MFAERLTLRNTKPLAAELGSRAGDNLMEDAGEPNTSPESPCCGGEGGIDVPISRREFD